MQHDYFQKRKQLNLLSVSVRVKHLLIFYCTLLLFDMQHDHILKKKTNFIFIWGIFGPRGRIEKKIQYFLSSAVAALLFSGVEPVVQFWLRTLLKTIL